MEDIKSVYEVHPNNFTITDGDDGTKTAVGNLLTVTILPDGDVKMFQRRAIKGIGGGSPKHETCLVAELKGVRCYVSGTNIVLSTRDLNI